MPNLAAGLQALAEPGSVVISQATRRLVGDLSAAQSRSRAGRRADRGSHRRRATIHRGADQGSAGIGRPRPRLPENTTAVPPRAMRARPGPAHRRRTPRHACSPRRPRSRGRRRRAKWPSPASRPIRERSSACTSPPSRNPPVVRSMSAALPSPSVAAVASKVWPKPHSGYGHPLRSTPRRSGAGAAHCRAGCCAQTVVHCLAHEQAVLEQSAAEGRVHLAERLSSAAGIAASSSTIVTRASNTGVQQHGDAPVDPGPS